MSATHQLEVRGVAGIQLQWSVAFGRPPALSAPPELRCHMQLRLAGREMVTPSHVGCLAMAAWLWWFRANLWQQRAAMCCEKAEAGILFPICPTTSIRFVLAAHPGGWARMINA
jgi:hypothetical protein